MHLRNELAPWGNELASDLSELRLPDYGWRRLGSSPAQTLAENKRYGLQTKFENLKARSEKATSGKPRSQWRKIKTSKKWWQLGCNCCQSTHRLIYLQAFTKARPESSILATWVGRSKLLITPTLPWQANFQFRDKTKEWIPKPGFSEQRQLTAAVLSISEHLD